MRCGLLAFSEGTYCALHRLRPSTRSWVPAVHRSTTARPQVQFLAGRDSVEYLLNTTDDNVLEMPDETLTIALYIPGMFPSYLGDLIAGVVIQVTTLADMASFSSSGLSRVSTRRYPMTHTSYLKPCHSCLMPYVPCFIFGRNTLHQQSMGNRHFGLFSGYTPILSRH